MGKSSKALEIEQAAEALGLTMHAEFVPWSQSRNKDEKQPSLNWKITLIKGGARIIATDYSAGCGHCPSYKASAKEVGGKDSMVRAEAIRLECETGKPARIWPGGGVGVQSAAKQFAPELADVLHSLVSDADAIDHPTYESWADECGYEQDSRKGEAIYRACLEIGLRLRAALGEAGLSQLREVCRDY